MQLCAPCMSVCELDVISLPSFSMTSQYKNDEKVAAFGSLIRTFVVAYSKWLSVFLDGTIG